jgi:hypothetical protein
MQDCILGFRRDVGGRVAPGLVVHAGDLTLPLGSGVTAVPFGAF